MKSRLSAVFTIFAFLLLGCDSADKPVASGTTSQAAPIADVSPVIVTPNQGVEVPLEFKGGLYFPPESKSACDASAQAGTLTVSCRVLADYHHVSEPVDLIAGQTYKIIAKVKGGDLISSREPYAAGLALLGEKMLIEVPSGSYDWRSVEATFTVPRTGPRKFTVGLGGWKQGKGKLEVKEMKLYK